MDIDIYARSRFVLVFVLLCFFVSENATAAAQVIDQGEKLEKEQRDKVQVVMMASLQQRELLDKLIEAIEGQLSDLPVEFKINWVESVSGDLPTQIRSARGFSEHNSTEVVFWCDLSQSEELYLYIADSGQHRILVRRLDSAQDQARFEAVAVIVHSVVDAIVRGGKIGVEVKEFVDKIEEKSKQIEKPPEQPKEKRSVYFLEETGYDIRGFSNNKPVVHGFNLELSLFIKNGFLVSLSYVFNAPIEINKKNGLSFELLIHPISLGLGYLWTIERFQLGAMASFIGNIVSQTTSSVSTTTAVKKENIDFVVGISPGVVLGFMFTKRVALRLKLGVIFDISGVEYVETTTIGGIEVNKGVETPWRIIPHGQLGLVIIFS